MANVFNKIADSIRQGGERSEDSSIESRGVDVSGEEDTSWDSSITMMQTLPEETECVLRNPLPALIAGNLIRVPPGKTATHKFFVHLENAVNQVAAKLAQAGGSDSSPELIQYFKLEGTWLSCYKNFKDADALWRTNIIDCKVELCVVPEYPNQSGIKITLPFPVIPETSYQGGSAVASRVKKENILFLTSYAKSSVVTWFEALAKASDHKVSKFYESGKYLGKGAYGEVRLARYKKDGSICAVKIIRKTMDADEEIFLVREMKVLRRVNNVHVVRTFDIFETAKTLYVLMEYLPGGDLYNNLAKMGGKMSEEKAGRVFQQIIEGCLYLHEKGVVHRDIKPENLLCASKEWPYDVKVADFGLCNLFDPSTVDKGRTLYNRESGMNLKLVADLVAEEKKGPGGAPAAAAHPDPHGDDLKPGEADHLFEIPDDELEPHHIEPPMKRPGADPQMFKMFDSMVGTPLFVAPDVITGVYGPAVDVWSCGIVLYNILSGQFPFDAPTSREVLERIRDRPVEFPKEYFSRVSPEGIDLLRNMLQKNPKKRITMAEILHHPWLTTIAPKSTMVLGVDLSSLHSRNRKQVVTGNAAANLASALDHLKLVNEL
eukprot:CAMPEP_0184698634 /NCGR_PEP_ID=MMETSP0313-20130426/5184_1 /TAXON_ID=2792 /ORGANISM="Porphyridium aerugineum, Strain SAG 1380-2" /LENGTH=602 /DNA_ID=CAMNT_0027157601 /DNA_START=184 /DNA_END=1992 /DNA_ORIENTATION=-